MMQTKLNYQICPLHDQPLNYLCLDAKCSHDKVICAICKQQRHSDPHLTMPLKIYLSNKAEQLKCLTSSKLTAVQHSLLRQKEKIKRTLTSIKANINAKLKELEQDCDSFFAQRLTTLKQCEQILNMELFEVQRMEVVQRILKIVSNHQDQEVDLGKQTKEAEQTICKVLKGLSFEYDAGQKKWQYHPQLKITENIVQSSNNSYKIAHLVRPISKGFNKATFRIISALKNWVGVGICSGETIKQKNHTFRYHTIGHGIYALSSNGGMWSHHRSDFNNKLGSLVFTQRETISVTYDIEDHRATFQNQKGQRFSLETDENERGNLHFCVLLYYEGDQVEVTPELSIVS